jgi:ketosteroid isomerase-like protein
MGKFVALVGTRVAFLVTLAMALFLRGESYAQSNVNDIKAAVDAYHAALSALDMSKMESLWAHDDYVMLVNPQDQHVSIGWDAVKKDWEMQFSALADLKVTQADGPNIYVKGDVAWSTGIASAVIKLKSGMSATAPTFETDVFEKRGGGWLLVSHTASSVSRPAP